MATRKSVRTHPKLSEAELNNLNKLGAALAQAQAAMQQFVNFLFEQHGMDIQKHALNSDGKFTDIPPKATAPPKSPNGAVKEEAPSK